MFYNQGMDFSHLPKFQITNQDSEEYGEYVKLTAALLKRPYMVVHKIFERENWSLEEIKRYYQNATKHSGDMKPSVYWWWQRKLRNETK